VHLQVADKVEKKKQSIRKERFWGRRRRERTQFKLFGNAVLTAAYVGEKKYTQLRGREHCEDRGEGGRIILK
jgi:hypothetical protein